MEVEYRHNYDNNLMIIKDDNIKINDYRINMLMKNKALSQYKVDL